MNVYGLCVIKTGVKKKLKMHVTPLRKEYRKISLGSEFVDRD